MSSAAITTRPEGLPDDHGFATLGYDVIAWGEQKLAQPDGPDAGGPWRYTPEQEDFLLWFYAIDDDGRFVFRRAALRRSKGWGKSPFAGGIGLTELVGPCRFGGWTSTRDPIVIPHPVPWVNLAGVSETQTQNTMTVILAMIEPTDLADEYGLDVGLTRILTETGGQLRPITASSSTQEGARPSFAILDEPHHWHESNGGHKLARVIRRNLAKSRDGAARALETTNAHEPGLGSVAEKTYQDFRTTQEGGPKLSGILYDSREAPADVELADEASLRAGLTAAYGDASWIDLDRLVGEVYDPGTPPEESRRFYLNQIVASADAWVAPHEWDRNGDDELKLADRETVVLGLDGGLRDDSTALVAVRVSDGAAFLVGLWERPPGPSGDGWEVDRESVRGSVDRAFETLDVVGFFSDVAYWETDVDRWRELYGEKLLVKASVAHGVAFDMRGNQKELTVATEALHRAILEGELAHDGDLRLARHVHNARRRLNRYGVSFGKENRESPKKIDALAALLLARMARQKLLGSGALEKRRPKTGTLRGYRH